MSIHKRQTKRHGTVYDVRRRDPLGRLYSRTFRTKREAENFEAQERTNANRGTWVDHRRSRTTFSNVAEEWLASNPTKRPSALARDAGIVRCHLLPSLAPRPVGSITPREVQDLVNTWAGKVAPRTVARQYGVLRTILAMAVERDYLGRSPCRGVHLPRFEPKQRRIVTPDKLVALAAATSIEYRPMVYLGAVLGLRWGEVAALRVGRVDLLRGTLTVAEGLTRDASGAIHEGPPKSEFSRRTMAIPGPVVDLLADHLRRVGFTGADATRWLFPSPGGGPLFYNNWRTRVWLPACRAAGLAGLGFHDLRAACATWMVADGVDVKTAQARLGHADPRLTLAIYAQATTEADRAAADRLGARLMPRPAESSAEAV